MNGFKMQLAMHDRLVEAAKIGTIPIEPEPGQLKIIHGEDNQVYLYNLSGIKMETMLEEFIKLIDKETGHQHKGTLYKRSRYAFVERKQ